MKQAVSESPLPSKMSLKLPKSLLHDRRFLFNRELSWLEFNRRVLQEAQDKSHPLLERLKFLSIFSTNLDEFFMIRVSGLKYQIDEGIDELSPDGMSPAEQLHALQAHLRPLLAEQMKCLREDVLPELVKNGVSIWAYSALSEAEKKSVNKYFMENVFPVLTPQAVDASHPFPYISNLSLNLGVMIEPKGGRFSKLPGFEAEEERFARIKLPPNVPRLVPVDEKNNKFTLLGELISANIHELFAGMKTGKPYLFRITRDADIEIQEDEAGDLLRSIEQELKQIRRSSSAIRLEVSSSMPEEMVTDLTAKLHLTDADVYRIEGFMNIPDAMQLYSLNLPALKDKPLAAISPKAIYGERNFFDALKKQDILLHHPFTNFSTVADFINAAANDKDVQAIKMCLYRTGKDSPIVEALMRASEKGKQVAALVELKARFDEENNIEWARRLESEGVHVVYGIRGLKTHCKVALVVRREGERLKRYVHIGTGNYNPSTGKIYTDLGLLTANEEIGADATDLFNYLTGFSAQTEYRQLLVAPVNLRAKMLELIQRETEHRENGRIIIKINSLTDEKMIHALYAASQAGVLIDLIVRGICVLRPEMQGLSEKICVRSIVGRFLEHSRVYYFGNAGKEEVYIGSADLMQRNLDRRVEVVTPILDARLRQYLKEELLAAYLKDNIKARQLNAEGEYERIMSSGNSEKFEVQKWAVGKEIVQ